MFTNLEESPITQLLQVLWRGRNVLGSSTVVDDIQIGMSVPHTVVYEHNFPKGLFYAGHDGSLQRRVGKEIDSKTVFGVFSDVPQTAAASGKQKGSSKRHMRRAGAAQVPGIPSRDPTGASDIVAVYTEKSAEAEGDVYSAQYFTDAGLRAFLLGSSAGGSTAGGGSGGTDLIDLHPVASKNGILQKFIYPLGVHNEIVQVVWTPHLCIAEKLRSCMLLGDTTKTPFQRAATIEAPANFCTRAYVSPNVADMIRVQCERLVDQLYVVERRFVLQMTLFFKVDADEHLWFLWSPSIRFSPQRASGGTEDHHQRPRHHTGAEGSSASSTAANPAGIVPKFLLPRSCGGDFAARAALFLSKNDTTHRPNKPIKGADDQDIKLTYKVTTNMSFDVVDEDTVLSRALPILSQRCLSQCSADATFVPPTKSKLCPKMRWLQGPISIDYRRQPLRSTTACSSDDAASEKPHSLMSSTVVDPRGSSVKLQGKKADVSVLSVASPMQSRAASPQMTGAPSAGGYPSPAHRPSHLASSGNNELSGFANGGGSTPTASAGHGKYSMRDLRNLVDASRNREAFAAETKMLQEMSSGGHTCDRSVISILRGRTEPEGSEQQIALLQSAIVKSVDQSSGVGEIEAELQRAAETNDSPSRKRAAETLMSTQSEGDLHFEMILLRQLCREPVHSRLQSDPASKSKMVAVKASMEVAAQFIQQLRDASVAHFLLFPTIPSTGVTCPAFAFSVPVVWLESNEVANALVALCGSVFEQISMEQACSVDRQCGRRGWSDDCSYHHEIFSAMSLAQAQGVVATAALTSRDASKDSHRKQANTNGSTAEQLPGRPSQLPQEEETCSPTSELDAPAALDTTATQEPANPSPPGDSEAAAEEKTTPAVEEPGVAGSEELQVQPEEQQDALSPPKPTDNTTINEPDNSLSAEQPSAVAQRHNDVADVADAQIDRTDVVIHEADSRHSDARNEDARSRSSDTAAADVTNPYSAPPSLADVRLPCFLVPNLGTLTDFLSRVTPFIVVTLRNVHNEVEQALLAEL